MEWRLSIDSDISRSALWDDDFEGVIERIKELRSKYNGYYVYQNRVLIATISFSNGEWIIK